MEGQNFVEGTILNGIPLMTILIKNPINSRTAIIELLIDSGAQHTLISEAILYEKLRFRQDDRIGDRVIQGIIPKEECIAYCPEFLVEVFINRKWLREIEVVAFNTTDDGILGRNVLQSFDIELKFSKNIVTFGSK